jgi:curved DNA-binding protein CbpA
MKDYYKLLEVKELASESEIKKAYHRLAKIYHPDKNENTKLAEDKFKEINEAYNVLSNPIKKSQYDALRKAKNQTFNYQYKGDFRGYQYNQSNQKKTNNPQSETQKKEPIPSRWKTLVIPLAFFAAGGLLGWFLKTWNENEKTTVIDKKIEAITIWPTGAIDDLGIKKFKLTTSNKLGKLWYDFDATFYDNNNIIESALQNNPYVRMNIEFLDKNNQILYSLPLNLSAAKFNFSDDGSFLGMNFNASTELSSTLYEKFNTISISKNF